MAEDSYLVGIDMGGTYIKTMITDRERNIVDKSTIRTNRELGYEKISDNIIAEVEALLVRNGLSGCTIAAMGMGVPGVVDNSNPESISMTLNFLGWGNFNACEKIANHFSAPYAMENDANLGAMGEYTFGTRMEYPNMVLLTLGTGVGGGIVADGKIYRGTRNLAGEFGHMQVTPDHGERCLCGRKGCLEAYCSGTAMETHAKRLLPDHPESILHELIADNAGIYDNRLVAEGARQLDPLCLEVFKRFNTFLSIGRANIMTLLNPGRIFIGGGISRAGDLIFDTVNRETLPRVRFERQFCPIEPASLGYDAGMYGAVALADMVAEQDD